MLDPLQNLLANPYVIALLLLVATQLFLKRKNRARQRRATSGDMERLPDAPEAVALFEEEPRTAHLKLIERHGPTFLMHVSPYLEGMYGVPRVVATVDPAMVRALLRGRKHVERRPDRYKAGMFIPGLAGVLWMQGEPWAERRRALNPVFRHETFAHYARWMHDAAAEAVGGWPADGGSVDLVHELRKLATEFVVGFGCDCDPASAAGRQLHAAMSEYDEKKRLAATGCCAVPRFLCGLGKLFGDAQRIRRAVAAVREQQRREAEEKATGGDSDEQLDDASGGGGDGGGFFRPGGGSGLPSWLSGMVEAGLEEKAIFNEINHLHGAHKAAAIMWAFTVYELCKAPEWQDTLRDEFEEVLDGRQPCELCREDLPKLTQTMCVWKEVLRMHPIALGVLRQTGEDVPLPPSARRASKDEDGKDGEDGDGITIPEGTPVVLLMQALHYHPDYWSDPTLFKPSRWANDTSALHTTSDPG